MKIATCWKVFIFLRHTQKQYNSVHSPWSLHLTNSCSEKVLMPEVLWGRLPFLSEVLADVFLVCLPVLLLDLIDLILQLYNCPFNLIVLTHQGHPI